MSRAYRTVRCILHRDDHFLLAVHSRFWGRQSRRWGLPGGRIEWRESPVRAAARELREELYLDVEQFTRIGDYFYKHSWHQVLAAPVQQPIQAYDQAELLDIRWFSLAELEQLAHNGELHAGYELEAVRHLLSGTSNG